MKPAGPFDIYRDCTLCPRMCRVDRTAQQTGYCGQSNRIRLAFAGLHTGEEPPISARGGSGTVFFAGCTLKCVFCQNWQVSHRGFGAEVSSRELAGVFVELQKRGAANINLVTGTPFTPGIIEALRIAREHGLSLPVVWNTSGYESASTLELLGRTVDVYLTDIKTLDRELAGFLFAAPDYPEVVRRSTKLMVDRRQPEYADQTDCSLTRGVIVRHLVMPGRLESTRAVLDWFRENLGSKALFSLMFQYTPVAATHDTTGAPTRRVSKREYERVMSWLEQSAIDEGFVQEYEAAPSELPDFTVPDTFPSELAGTVWHYTRGFVDRAQASPRR